MITADVYDDSHIVISSTLPSRDKDRILTLPGAVYNTKKHAFLAPLTWSTARMMHGIFGEQLVTGEALAQWKKNEWETRVYPAITLRLAWEAQGDDDLYPFQRAGVQFLAYARRALLCDEMGTGKTVQTIRTLSELVKRDENPFPAIIVAPNNMVITWRKEFEKWWPGIKVNVVKGSMKQRQDILKDKAHVYVINYESVRRHSRLAAYGSIRLKRCIVCEPTLADTKTNQQSSCEWCKKDLNVKDWKTVIVDEVHRMKDPNAKQTRAIWALRTTATVFVYGLTGTLIANAPHDMWSPLHLCAPEEFPSRAKYMDRYCQSTYNPFMGIGQIIGLQEGTKPEFFDIVDPRLRRMPKDAVLPWLPKKTYSERYIEMTPKQKKAYEQMEAGLVADLGSGVVVAINPLVQLTRMTQFASAFAELDEEGSVSLSAPSNKVDAMMEIIEEMDGKSLVVFAKSRQLVGLAEEALKRHKIDYALIVGGQTADEREHEKENFQLGRVPVILCTIAAGGIGITLTRADTALFLERSWSMVENSQAEDRVHRIGSEIHDKITIVDLISIGTVEERQRIALGGKLDRLEEVMRDRDTLLRVLGVRPL
jgi:SNF2 family DNA or RNA helicase